MTLAQMRLAAAFEEAAASPAVVADQRVPGLHLESHSDTESTGVAMDLSTSSRIGAGFNMFQMMSDVAPGAEIVTTSEIKTEVSRILDLQRQRAGQRYGVDTELLHHPLPARIPTSRGLRLVDAYFQVGRGVLWKYGMEVLAVTRASQTQTSVGWIAASTIWKQMRPDLQDYVRRSVSDVQLAVNWERLRIAYTVDPGLHRALCDTETEAQVPPGILQQLPHPDPVFLLPQAVPVTVADGTPGLLRAFFLRGLLDGHYSTSTADPDISHMQLCALTSLEDVNGVPVDWDLSGVSIPLDRTFTVDSVSHYSATRWDGQPEQIGDLAQVQSWTRQLLQICLPVVMYCCSVNADRRRAQPSPGVAKKQGGKRSKNRPVPASPTYELGYRVGPVLAAAAVRHAAAVRAGGGAGGTRRPHVRRAHWHTYWYGPRDDRTPRLKWVGATVIHPEGDPVTTVVPVR